MSRKRTHGVIKPNGTYALIYHDIIDSQAFKLISHPAKVVYLLLRRQCNPHNQRVIIFPADDACKYMSRGCFFKAIKNLEKYGFIKADRKGCFPRVPNEHLIIDGWRKVEEVRPKRALTGIALKESSGRTNRKGKKGLVLSPLEGRIPSNGGSISPREGLIISPSEGPQNFQGE